MIDSGPLNTLNTLKSHNSPIPYTMPSIKLQLDAAVAALKTLATARGVDHIGVDMRFVAKDSYVYCGFPYDLTMILFLNAVKEHGVVEIEAEAKIVFEHPHQTNTLRESPSLAKPDELPAENYVTYEELIDEMVYMDEGTGLIIPDVVIISSSDSGSEDSGSEDSDNIVYDDEDPRKVFQGHKGFDLGRVRPQGTSFTEQGLVYGPGDHGYEAPSPRSSDNDEPSDSGSGNGNGKEDEKSAVAESVACVQAALELIGNRRMSRSMTQAEAGGNGSGSGSGSSRR